MGTLYFWGVHRKYNYDWNPPYTSFSSGTRVRLGSIEQEHKNAWTTFILDTSKGLTKAGIERINDSIRTYVWCLLGSQAQTRSSIMDSSTGFDAQKQYLANLEDAINSAVDLPSSIKRYEDVLRYARSKVDFAVGGGLYMLPSDLRLQIGTIVNYNNEILVAGDDRKLGKNEDVNSKPAVVLENKKDDSRPYDKTENNSNPSAFHSTIVQRIHHPIPRPQKEGGYEAAPAASVDNHEAQKTALVVGLTGLGLLTLYLVKK
jgi:hypothetical protein